MVGIRETMPFPEKQSANLGLCLSNCNPSVNPVRFQPELSLGCRSQQWLCHWGRGGVHGGSCFGPNKLKHLLSHVVTIICFCFCFFFGKNTIKLQI